LVTLDEPVSVADAVAEEVDETPMQLDVPVRRDEAVAVDTPTTPVSAEVDAKLEVPVAVQAADTPVRTDVPVCSSEFSSSGKKKLLNTTVLTGSSLYQLTSGLTPSAHSGRSPLIFIRY
jgi:hypothetical protein